MSAAIVCLINCNSYWKNTLTVQAKDGMDIYPYLHILQRLVSILSETKLTSQEINEILPGYCAGSMLCRVIESIRALPSIDQLNSNILNRLMPIVLKEHFKAGLSFHTTIAYGTAFCVFEWS